MVESENTHIELFEECAKDLNEFVDDKNGGISFKYEVDEEIIKECVEKGFLKNKYYSGNYFRALYRCLKYIMDSDLKMEDKKFYSGVLRGILSSDEMLVVFYNCMYFEKGEKFKELLEREEDGKRIDFFGDKNDLKNLSEGYDLPFFSKEDLLFSETDMQKLEELIKGN
ncbi:putative phage abortive infection protein [Lactococcus lactis]|uniref:putative phage abortive infection protein n=1 Tax=Lactococcus lactis TaxID=1358 RepID=UPI003F65148B